MKGKIMLILLNLSLLSLCFCEYKKLSKHGSVKVAPNINVYLELDSFDNGDLISFTIKMDLSYGGSKDYYDFKIDQVPAQSYYDSSYWTNLQTVRNRNVTCKSGGECTFSWDIVKREGSKYIYIIPLEPFPSFYSFWGEKIKITNKGGELSAGAIAGIVIAVIVFVVFFIVLISCCCCQCAYNNGCCRCCYCCYCCCCRRRYYGGVANIPYSQPVYPPPQPVYPPPGTVPVYPTGGQVVIY